MKKIISLSLGIILIIFAVNVIGQPVPAENVTSGVLGLNYGAGNYSILGKLGIGTSAPLSANLHVFGQTGYDTKILLENSNSNIETQLVFKNGTSESKIRSSGNIFGINSPNMIHINSNTETAFNVGNYNSNYMETFRILPDGNMSFGGYLFNPQYVIDMWAPNTKDAYLRVQREDASRPVGIIISTPFTPSGSQYYSYGWKIHSPAQTSNLAFGYNNGSTTIDYLFLNNTGSIGVGGEPTSGKLQVHGVAVAQTLEGINEVGLQLLGSTGYMNAGFRDIGPNNNTSYSYVQSFDNTCHGPISLNPDGTGEGVAIGGKNFGNTLTIGPNIVGDTGYDLIVSNPGGDCNFKVNSISSGNQKFTLLNATQYLMLGTNGQNVGIGGLGTPFHTLSVNGTFYVNGTVNFQTLSGTGNRMVVADQYGLLSTLPMPNLPTGTTGQTMRHDGTNWIANSLIYNNGTNIGIGTTNPSATIDIFNSTNTANIKVQGYAPNQATGVKKTAASNQLINTFNGDLFLQTLRKNGTNSEMIQSVYDASSGLWREFTFFDFPTRNYEIRNGITSVLFKNTGITSFGSGGGNVGIGTQSPEYGFDVQVASRFTQPVKVADPIDDLDAVNLQSMNYALEQLYLELNDSYEGVVGWENNDGSFTHQIWKNGRLKNQKIDNKRCDELEIKNKEFYDKKWEEDYANAVAQKPEENCKIIPNPFETEIVINCEALPKNEEATVLVRNASGKFIGSFSFAPGEKIKISNITWPTGMYLFTIMYTSGEQRYSAQKGIKR